MCPYLSRRTVLAGLAGAIAAPGAVAQAYSGLPPYCAISGASLSASELYSQSGNPNLDHALITELRRIISILPVSPGFKYIQDPQPNAFATPDTYVQGTRGTVLLGVNLLNQESSSSQYGGVAIAGICAHECGHIFQYFSEYYQQLEGTTARNVELHADFIGGFYMGRRAEFVIDKIAVFARSVFNKGDYNYNAAQHHGTPDQRFSAMKRGYELGKQNSPFDQAVAEGAAFVTRL